ncbi:MAG TPA: DNA-directed RNA polymerase subunit alpha [Candidatus Paceibacterota bacterium]
MSEIHIVLPSKPRAVEETANYGHYEIDGLYPGYGHTLGNSLRRIILSSLPGAAITSVKIDGVSHEFATIDGVKEDVINIILNLKKIRFSISGDESQTISLKKKGIGAVTAADFKLPGQVELSNPEHHILDITGKDTEIDMEVTVEKGIGFVAKELLHKDRVDIGSISLDAAFSPILLANYDVEQTRVGDRTDFNKLKVYIKTDGTISPRDAFEKSIEIMITQLKAIIGFKETETETAAPANIPTAEETAEDKEALDDTLKTRIESVELSQRTANALVNANIRTVGGLIRKKEKDILDLEGLGSKGLEEIKTVLEGLGLSLKA